MQTVEQLVDSVSRLVSLPEVYLRVREIVENPRARMADLAGVIVRDPALTARLLRIANSAVFGHSGRVETVTRAVTLLGSRPLLDLVLATSVTRAFAGVSPTRMDVQTFWRRSVYCGVVARNLATRCNVLDVERLFVEGLLRDVGHLVLFDRIPEQADAALKRAAETGRPLAEVERETLGFDYAEVGAALLRRWKLPDGLCAAVRFHVRPEEASASPFETALVHIAAVLTDAFAEGQTGVEATARVAPVAWRGSGVDPETATEAAEAAAREVSGVVELVLGGEPRRTPESVAR
ncbi:MAG: HDOD domain-containing protein [Gammaproteobacteria bacterium]|nr:HDOD domain-containing protein [Gammaproteobacteria bacterium]